MRVRVRKKTSIRFIEVAGAYDGEGILTDPVRRQASAPMPGDALAAGSMPAEGRRETYCFDQGSQRILFCCSMQGGRILGLCGRGSRYRRRRIIEAWSAASSGRGFSGYKQLSTRGDRSARRMSS